MFFYDLAAKSIFCADGAIVRTLRCWISTGGKAQGFVGFRIPKEIFLFESKPEVIVIVFDGGPPVRHMRSTIGVKNFTHYKVGVLAAWIREDCYRLQQAV